MNLGSYPYNNYYKKCVYFVVDLTLIIFRICLVGGGIKKKKKKKKKRENIFSGCLVGRRRGKKKLMGFDIFFLGPLKCFFSKIKKKL